MVFVGTFKLTDLGIFKLVLTHIVHVTHRIHHRRLGVAIRHAHRIFPALHTAILRKLAIVVGVVRTHPDLRLIQQQRQRIRILLLTPAVRRMAITTVQTQAHHQIPHKYRMHLHKRGSRIHYACEIVVLYNESKVEFFKSSALVYCSIFLVL